MLATTSNPSWRRRAAACWGPSTPGATRLSTKLQRSLAKYTTTAARVPKCSSTSKASSGVRKPSSFGTIDRWADDEIGRNSVSPWTMPSTKVRSTADRSPFHVGARPGKYRSSRSIPQRVSSDLEASPGQGGGADAGPVGRERGDHGDQQVPELGVVLLEDPDHLGVRDRLHAGRAFQADVVIGDQRHVDVADLELACERRLRIAGHVDDLPAGVLVPAGLGAGREPRPLHDHHGAAVVRGDT